MIPAERPRRLLDVSGVTPAGYARITLRAIGTGAAAIRAVKRTAFEWLPRVADEVTPFPTDRFVCRREGHKPSLHFSKITITGHDSDEPFRYLTTCLVCGEWYEEEVPVSGRE